MQLASGRCNSGCSQKIHGCMCVYICVHVWAYMCICVWAYVCICVHICICMYVYVYVYMYVCGYVYVYVGVDVCFSLQSHDMAV